MPLTKAGSHVNQKETVQSVTSLEIQIQDGPTFTTTTVDAGLEVGLNIKVTQQGRDAAVGLLGN